AKVIVTLRERSKTLKDMAEGAKFYFVDKIEYDEKAEKKFLKPENADISATLSTKLSNLTTFNETSIEGVFNEVMEETELKLGKIAQPVRVALTGTTISPGIFETIETLGQQKTVERLKNATEHMRKKE
ncbi:MAG: glutamate--tRNA ligase, partial [Deltaproteobacteria bacterium]|nr:glutamate--tRNA ligase [Deltaproteobacteria bacterium]